MPKTVLATGVVVVHPETVEIASGPAPSSSRAVRRGPVPHRGPVPLPGDASAGEEIDAGIVAAFKAQDLDLVDTVELRPGPSLDRRRGPGTPPVQIDLDVERNESGVLLLEQEGVYRWLTPTAADTAAAAPAGARRGEAATGATLRFEVPFDEAATAPGAARRGLFTDLVLGPVKAWIFRFVARAALDHGVRLFEQNVSTGLVRIASSDPANWTRVGRLASSGWPVDRPPRVLLFVHGTFSSTVGGFGALTATPWGLSLLQACLAHYDVVLGYDHRTLAEDPLQNAARIFEALREQDWGRHPPQIDAVAHSRGGLVVRSLVEHILPATGWNGAVRRAILVGATNAGTRLADPENWSTLAALYTNIAVAACRALALVPGAATASTILREVVSSVGALVKHLATGALEADAVPGLAAMQPSGRFIATLNELQSGQPRPETSVYHVVTAEFQPRVLDGDHKPREMPLRLAMMLAGGFVTRLMRDAANDLVVDTASMSAIDASAGNFVRDALSFGATPYVYHTNYFARPELVQVLARWLEVPQPPADGTVLRGSPSRQPGPPAILLNVAPVPGGLPAAVDPSILVESAAAPSQDLLERIHEVAPSYVVLRRSYQGGVLDYAFRPGEIVPRLAVGQDRSALEALDLRETGRSEGEQVSRVWAQGNLPARRTVAFAGDRPVGVVPAANEAMLEAGIAEIARSMLASPDPLELRRVMPSLAAALEDRPPKAPDAAPVEAQCHFHAEMKPAVRLGTTTSVHVTVSREEIERALSGTSAGAAAGVALDRKLVIDVWPKRGFELADDAEPAEVEPPEPGSPLDLAFRVRATASGRGEIWVVVRQSRLPLATMKLFPEVVAGDAAQESSGATPVQASVSAAEAPRGQAPLHELTIWEQATDQGTIFRFELRSQGIGIIRRYASNVVRGDRRRYVENIYADIESRWTGSRRQATQFARDLQTMGAELWREIVPVELQRVLWDNRDRLDSVFVVSEEPFIPWELLCVVEPGASLKKDSVFFGELGVVRWLFEAAAAPPAELAVRRGRARSIIPNYPEIPALGLRPLPEAQKEAKGLREKLGAEPIVPLPSEVQEVLESGAGFDLLHFAGHGFAATDTINDAQIMLDGERVPGGYVPSYLTADEIRNRADFGGSRPFVVLNACQAGRANWKLTGLGGFARAFLERGAGAFVGALWSVGDAPARVFTEALYDSLLAGRRMAEAVRVARSAAKDARDAAWLSYAVYAHPNAVLKKLDA
jgi:hypothetical protein